MLEKTAASLEPCGFHRVVPGATQSFRTTRQLRNTFWQHGATGLELTATWQALMHGTLDFTGSTSDQNRGLALGASAFLLDFLYPTGAVTLGRRLSSVNAAPYSRSKNIAYGPRFTKLVLRLFTSSHAKRQDDRPTTESATSQKSPEPDGSNSTNGGSATYSEDVKATEMGGVPDISSTDATQRADRQINETLAQSEPTTDDPSHFSGGNDHLEALDYLLNRGSDDPKDADRVWYHYRALDESSQTTYLHQVLLHLSQSGRLSDSWKISELFNRLPPSQWTNDVFVAGVAAEVNLQNDDRALEVFVEGLEHNALDVPPLVDGLDLILASALRSSTPELLRSLWKHYPSMAARWDFEGIISQLKQVALVPGLAEKALEFQTRGRQELQESDGAGLGQEALNTLQRILVRGALLSCADDQVIPLLDITKDPLAFEEFLRKVSSRGREKLAIEVYRIYRDLPESMPSHQVLYEMFKVYSRLRAPMSIKYAGIELLWGDWHKFHTIPSHRAFQRYLAFFAARGDTENVYSLWTKLMEKYRDDPRLPAVQADDTFSHLLQVHAVRGEVEETQRIFDDISRKFHIQHTNHHCNILLNAYAKASDYSGAIYVFETLVAAGKTDHYSFGTMMQMAGGRGDLGFTIDLYRQAKSFGIPINDAILSSLVDAYCQNDYLHEAEDICVRAVKKGVVVTRLWNKLLHYHALRRDLAAINRLLDLMAEKGVPYNEFTYQQLLLGLALCRQSQHALNLLAVALKDEVFEVTSDHFHIVMGALLITGEPASVQRLHEMMQDRGYPSSSASLFRVIQALGQWKNLPPRQRARSTATESLGKALRSFYQMYGLNDRNKLEKLSSPTKRSSSGELLGSSTEKFHFSTMVYMLTEMKDFVRARELIDLYVYVFRGEQGSDGLLPVAMFNSLMLADLHEKHYDRVGATWKLLFDAAKKEARSADFAEDVPHSPKISPKYRYVLSEGLGIVQRMLFLKGNASGIQSVVGEVQSAGFEIDSKNWNYYVQALVRLKQYKEAFLTCEKILMPNWTGWNVVRRRENIQSKLSLDSRRKGTSSRHLRPVATTLYQLAHGYMELDQLGPWSAEMARTAQEIEKECVQVVRAIKSMVRVHSNLEYEILGEGDRLDIDESTDLEYDSQDSDIENTEEKAGN